MTTANSCLNWAVSGVQGFSTTRVPELILALKSFIIIDLIWSRWSGLNRLPRPYQGRALPFELQRPAGH